jgi:membrane protein YqaA with SNARE-associated domain
VNGSTALPDRAPAADEYDRLPARVWWLGGLMVAIGLITFFLMSTQGERHGYWYLLFYSIPSNTAISIFPHEPVLIYYGRFANIWISAAAATGGTLIAGYLDHRVFVPLLNYSKVVSYKKSRFYRKAIELFMRHPFATIVVTGFTPIPFWPFKFLCLSIRYPLHRYLAALSMARFPRYAVLAWLGAVVGIPDWILISSVVVVFSAYGVRAIPALRDHLRARRRGEGRPQAGSPRARAEGPEMRVKDRRAEAGTRPL